ncbi:MAG: hypothetical protein JKY65_00005 [Planctomycetes bacterium]|nr:hypothetical protein [Planctomycetota bacterium]
MRASRRTRIVVGALIWIGAGLAVWPSVQAGRERLAGPLGQLWRYTTQGQPNIQRDLPGPLAIGDPILLPDRTRLGAVVAIGSGSARASWDLPHAETYAVTIAFDPEVEVPDEFVLRSRATPMDGAWVLETLLPESKRRYVEDQIRAFLRDHEDTFMAFVRPLAEEVVAEATKVLEANLTKALSKREPEIQKLLDKHREKVRTEIVPVLKKELGPSAKSKADPILREIGRELWDELPMWSLGWRAFVDVLPGTRNDRVDKWWSEFVDNKAIPILEKHEEELMTALEELIEEAGRNPAVRKEMSKATKRLAKDPEFRKLARGILEDALLRPFHARDLFERLLAQPAHRERLRALSRAFAPTLQRIARKLTVDDKTGKLDPALVRVLRRVVFYKDARYVELVPVK